LTFYAYQQKGMLIATYIIAFQHLCIPLLSFAGHVLLHPGWAAGLRMDSIDSVCVLPALQ